MLPLPLTHNSPWRLIRTGHCDGPTNMALDKALLLSTGAPPTLRLYGWKPWTLSLGYFQDGSAFDKARYRSQGYGIVRRPTGGSAIFHAEELTFALTLPEDNPWIPRKIPLSYRKVHEAVQKGLEKVGVSTSFRGLCENLPAGRGSGFCFDDPADCDLMVGRLKIVGSAQRRTRGRLLHHGSIILRTNVMTPSTGSVEGCGGQADFETVERAIVQGFEEHFGIALVETEPSFEELAVVERLVSEVPQE